MSSNTSLSPPPAEEVLSTTSKPRSTRKPAVVKKPTVAKGKSTAKVQKVQSKATKPKSAVSSHPSWKDIIIECITFNKADARQGVSRSTIKKFAEEKYKLESSAANIYQLNRAITTGAESGMFSLPKGPSGKVKLAPKVKSVGGAKENSKPPSKAVVPKAATKATGVKKAAVTKAAVKKSAVPTKKVMAGKGKATSTVTKKSTAATKRGSAKKGVTGTTAAVKAKAAATTKKGAVKKGGATKVAAKPRSAKPGSRGKKIVA